MLKEKRAESHDVHAFSQFTLTQKLLNNLSQFKITPAAKLVLLELSSFYNPKKADMFPKQKTLAKKIGISERSVVRAIQELLNEGLIMVECKYSNHYKFTSRIVKQQPEIKNFSQENMSEVSGQNSAQLRDNLAQHEPTSEPFKEPSGIEDFKILKEYAISKGAKNVSAYVNVLRKNGSAAKIISEYKSKEKVTQRALRSVQETQELIKKYNDYASDISSPNESEAWKNLGIMFGIKKSFC